MTPQISCPFCSLRSCDEYRVQLHIEENHTDDSPFALHHNPSSLNHEHSADSDVTASNAESPPPEVTWVRCTRDGCRESVRLSDIDEHLDFHIAMSMVCVESQALDISKSDRNQSVAHPTKQGSSNSSGRLGDHNKLQKRHSSRSTVHREPDQAPRLISKSSMRSIVSSRSLHRPQNPGRLGEKELGPYAFETSMPSEVRRRLVSEAQPRYVNRIRSNGKLSKEKIVPNETSGLVNALADLCALDKSNAVTYLCHPSVRHIQKLQCDGNFCGYWNIQMLLTYLQHSNPQHVQQLPNVIQIQELIEKAWENDICAYGIVETGGVMNTRKWIGTHEALAFFTQIGTHVDALSFRTDDRSSEGGAMKDLLDHIEALFMRDIEVGIRHETSLITQIPPVYLQRLGHSMTIIGLERKTDGSRNLLVLDPSYAVDANMLRLLAKKTIHSPLGSVIGPYRRSEESLNKWKEFEIIM